jgi:hypothetical protein
MDSNIISEPIEFEWDEGNKDKNFKKHGILNEEAEEAFLNDPLVFEDLKHSKSEKRYQCLGVTDKNKRLFVSFTTRDGKIRVISVRSMDKKETEQYEQKT